MSATVAFHPTARPRQSGDPNIEEFDFQSERQHARREAASLASFRRAKYDPQSSHDRQGAEQRLAQAQVAIQVDAPSRLLG
jgi:hypothetical protein